jgi:uncharacterized protein (DUF697 family)
MTQLSGDDPSAFEQIVQRMIGTISNAELVKAKQKVAALRSRSPAANADEVAGMLIRQKCIETGLVGMATAAPALIPGIGAMLATTAGLMIDLQKTIQMQKDLVLELAIVYDHDLTALDQRNLLMLIAVKVGSELATEAGSRLLVKVIPFAGIAASAGTNLVSTYLVGQRAQVYMKLDGGQTGDWRESARTLSGIDERQLADWLAETLRNAGPRLQGPLRQVDEAVAVAGRLVERLPWVGR